MKAGYVSELQARRGELEGVKGELETLFMNPVQEPEILNNPELHGSFTTCFAKVETHLATYGTTVKSVKLAIVSWLWPLFNSLCLTCNFSRGL